MLSAVGHGTAMPQSPSEVIAAARYVAPPLFEEGAGEIIARLALGDIREARAAAGAYEEAATVLREPVVTASAQAPVSA
mgnify:CR=1 FL=1